MIINLEEAMSFWHTIKSRKSSLEEISKLINLLGHAHAAAELLVSINLPNGNHWRIGTFQGLPSGHPDYVTINKEFGTPWLLHQNNQTPEYWDWFEDGWRKSE